MFAKRCQELIARISGVELERNLICQLRVHRNMSRGFAEQGKDLTEFGPNVGIGPETLERIRERHRLIVRCPQIEMEHVQEAKLSFIELAKVWRRGLGEPVKVVLDAVRIVDVEHSPECPGE